jgi:hypothetical protein
MVCACFLTGITVSILMLPQLKSGYQSRAGDFKSSFLDDKGQLIGYHLINQKHFVTCDTK